MQVIEYLEQNNKSLWLNFKLKLKSNIVYQIIRVILLYWIIGNIILFSLFNVFNTPWKIISGFNLGFIGSLLGFLLLNLSSKWFVSNFTSKQILAYLIFLFRMLLYGTLIVLAFYFNFANLISIIIGLSLLMIATLTNEFWIIIKIKKEKKKCWF